MIPLRDGSPRKHAHVWRLVLTKKHYMVDEVEIRRECVSCGERQTAMITDKYYNTLPPSVAHLADAKWEKAR